MLHQSDILVVIKPQFYALLQVPTTYVFDRFKKKNTVKPLYTDIRYNHKIYYNDNLNGRIP